VEADEAEGGATVLLAPSLGVANEQTGYVLRMSIRRDW